MNLQFQEKDTGSLLCIVYVLKMHLKTKISMYVNEFIKKYLVDQQNKQNVSNSMCH